ncbi:hypothetical protein U1Q18_041557 [Sarracenia purpurea var. burkii]
MLSLLSRASKLKWTLTADRGSDGEDVVIGEMQSSEGEEGERDEVDGPVMDQSEEGPVASESKGEVRGRRAEACKVFENVPQSKTDGPGAGYGHSGFVQNGAGQSWADIVGNREICYPRPLVSESNGARSEMELEFIKCSEDSSGKRKEKGEAVIKVAARGAISQPAVQNRGPPIGQPRCSAMNPALHHHSVSGVSPSASGVLTACLDPPLSQAVLASKFNQAIEGSGWHR